MGTHLFLARHGQTTWNAESRYQGQLDIPLDERGLKQVAALGQRLAGQRFDAIYASDLQRAWQTATAIAVHQPCIPQPEPRLRELDFGRWQGYTFDQIRQREPQDVECWLADRLNHAPGSGESLLQLANRVQSLVQQIQQDYPDGNLLLVAHGGSLKALLCLGLGLSPEQYWRFRLDNASLTEMTLYAEGGILRRFNDTAHLEGLK